MLRSSPPSSSPSTSRFGYDPRRAATAAAILAESGKTADQIGRLMHHFDFDATTIRDALLSPVDDAERSTLFTVADARAALHEIDDTIDLDEIAPFVQRPAADGGLELSAESDGPLDDVRLLQRRIRQHAEPGTIAALASGLELEPATVIGVCRATDVAPPRAMAIAVALRHGDAKAAYGDLTTNWPDIDGGWDRHSHPSLEQGRHLSAVPERKATRDILDRWTGRARPAIPSPEPLHPS